MIIKMLSAPVFLLLEGLITLIPDTVKNLSFPDWSLQFFDLVSKGLWFFPPDVFVAIFASIILWTGIHLAWAIVEWCYKKIPGIN